MLVFNYSSLVISRDVFITSAGCYYCVSKLNLDFFFFSAILRVIGINLVAALWVGSTAGARYDTQYLAEVIVIVVWGRGLTSVSSEL